MNTQKYQQFLDFLEDELKVTPKAIALATRQGKPSLVQLPIVLWQYGLVSLQQLNSMFEWQEGH